MRLHIVIGLSPRRTDYVWQGSKNTRQVSVKKRQIGVAKLQRVTAEEGEWRKRGSEEECKQGRTKVVKKSKRGGKNEKDHVMRLRN